MKKSIKTILIQTIFSCVCSHSRRGCLSTVESGGAGRSTLNSTCGVCLSPQSHGLVLVGFGQLKTAPSGAVVAPLQDVHSVWVSGGGVMAAMMQTCWVGMQKQTNILRNWLQTHWMWRKIRPLHARLQIRFSLQSTTTPESSLHLENKQFILLY